MASSNRTLHHSQSLAQELRPLGIAVAIILATFALSACGSNEQVRGESTPEVVSQVVEHAADHAAHADQAAHNDHADHSDHTVDHEMHTDSAAEHSAGHHAHPSALPAGALPGTSIYHLASAWSNSRGGELSLPELRGAPAVFVMFYGDCTTACPLLVKAAEDISAALSEEQRAATNFVMVSFDIERDTPARLAAYAAEKELDSANWHWLVGSPLQTRQLATLLGVQYRDAGNGMFAHSNVVTVLDGDGVPTARLEGLGIDLEPAVSAIVSARH